MREAGGEGVGVNSVLSPYPVEWASGSRGGCQKSSSILGAFLNALFHSEHFEFTHVG